jgi:RNA polymerase sigma factor (sigma-70 family)
MANSITRDTIHHLVTFQKTGNTGCFAAFWADAEAFVEHHAAAWLRRHLVVSPDGRPDATAVDDVKQGFVVRILELPDKPNESGWFNPDTFGWKPDRLRAWVYQVMKNAAVDYCKKFHGLGRKGAACITFGDLEFNAGGNFESVLKPSPKVDFDAFELREIVAECLGELAAEQQTLCRQILIEGLSQREIAKRTGISPSSVCHAWKKVAHLLEAKLVASGVNAAWLAEAA